MVQPEYILYDTNNGVAAFLQKRKPEFEGEMMVGFVSRWWPLLLLIPVVSLAVVALFFPLKIMRFMGREMNPFDMDDGELDNIIEIPIIERWMRGGRSRSEHVNAMKDHPEGLRYLIIWIRGLGFVTLMMVLFTLCLLSLAIRSGALIV